MPELDTTIHPGLAHYEALLPRFSGFGPTRAKLPVDLEQAGRILIGVQKTLDDRGLVPLLSQLPSRFFDSSRLGDFGRLGWALRYVASMRKTALATAQTALVSPEIIAPAEALKARMLKVLTHYFGDHPVIGKEVAAIREGRSYADLVEDLPRLARLYVAQQAMVAADPMHYRETDVADAHAYYARLGELLGERDASDWNIVALQAFGYAEREYDELRAAVGWAFRAEPETVAAFPSLYPRSASKRPETVETPTAPASPAAPAVAPAPPVA